MVDDRSAPNYIRHSWLLNGAVVEDPEDPGMDDPGFVDPGLEIPTGPTKEELTQQIKEKEALLDDMLAEYLPIADQVCQGVTERLSKPPKKKG